MSHISFNTSEWIKITFDYYIILSWGKRFSVPQSFSIGISFQPSTMILGGKNEFLRKSNR